MNTVSFFFFFIHSVDQAKICVLNVLRLHVGKQVHEACRVCRDSLFAHLEMFLVAKPSVFGENSEECTDGKGSLYPHDLGMPWRVVCDV